MSPGPHFTTMTLTNTHSLSENNASHPVTADNEQSMKKIMLRLKNRMEKGGIGKNKTKQKIPGKYWVVEKNTD